MFNSILTYVDANKRPSWKYSLPKTVSLAKKCNAKLHIMTCIPDFNMTIVEQFFSPDIDKDVISEKLEAEKLNELKSFISEFVPPEIKCHPIVGIGSIRDLILSVSEKINADLIVLSRIHRKNMFSDFGATAAHVVRHAKCSVLIVRKNIDGE